MQANNLQQIRCFDFPMLPLTTLIPRLSGTPLAHGQFVDPRFRSLEYPIPPKGKPRSRQGSSEKLERQTHHNPTGRKT